MYWIIHYVRLVGNWNLRKSIWSLCAINIQSTLKKFKNTLIVTICISRHRFWSLFDLSSAFKVQYSPSKIVMAISFMTLLKCYQWLIVHQFEAMGLCSNLDFCHKNVCDNICEWLNCKIIHKEQKWTEVNGMEANLYKWGVTKTVRIQKSTE